MFRCGLLLPPATRYFSRVSGQTLTTPSSRKRKAPHDAIFFDGVAYASLPWFLGRVFVKSSKIKAVSSGFMNLAHLRDGNPATLGRYVGQEILAPSSLQTCRHHRWMHTICNASHKNCARMQCRLISEGAFTLFGNLFHKISDLKTTFL